MDLFDIALAPPSLGEMVARAKRAITQVFEQKRVAATAWSSGKGQFSGSRPCSRSGYRSEEGGSAADDTGDVIRYAGRVAGDQLAHQNRKPEAPGICQPASTESRISHVEADVDEFMADAGADRSWTPAIRRNKRRLQC